LSQMLSEKVKGGRTDYAAALDWAASVMARK
jgi:hypothetical protein